MIFKILFSFFFQHEGGKLEKGFLEEVVLELLMSPLVVSDQAEREGCSC